MFCMARRISILLIAASLMIGTAQADGDSLFEAIRAGDVQRVRAAIRAGTDANTRDETGATLLMYAVIHGSRECISLLLDRGADVNAANRYGSTALMWAGGDASMVKSLLDRGAAVDAQTTDGTTALLVAARYGNLESLRLLLEHGASGAISPNVREELLRIAYSDSDSTMLRMLERFGLKLTHGSELRGPVVSPNVTQPAVMRRFLELGASPQETATTSTITLPALSYAAGQAAAPAVAALLDHGADPNARGSRGLTPLMMAAAVDDTVEATELLLARGADVALRDEAGRTALDWALMRGETPIARVLRQAGAVRWPPHPPRQHRLWSREQHAMRWPELSRSCRPLDLHSASGRIASRVTVIAFRPSLSDSLATMDIPVDQALAVHPAEATLADWARERERNLLAGLPPRGGRAAIVNNLAYGLFALAAEEVAPTAVTDAVALRFAALQNHDGSWDGGASTFARIRPPLNATPIPTTALAIRGLSVYASSWPTERNHPSHRSRSIVSGAGNANRHSRGGVQAPRPRVGAR